MQIGKFMFAEALLCEETLLLTLANMLMNGFHFFTLA